MKRIIAPLALTLAVTFGLSQAALARPSRNQNPNQNQNAQCGQGKHRGKMKARFDLNHDGRLDTNERQQALAALMSNPKFQQRLQRKGMTVEQFREKFEQRGSRRRNNSNNNNMNTNTPAARANCG